MTSGINGVRICEVDHSVVSQNSSLNCPHDSHFVNLVKQIKEINAQLIVAHQAQLITRGTCAVNL
ncbi:hypothetical protein MICAB_2210002 [Microcystis aeruginosa PCC 9717]|uniref:Uncharacterized protein n=1 Tax=Microcystis aeruginosa PCC 9717 TaxID=1160286 RepID=I4FLK2_MICAE|nr:hypothetical protein MICAB_2210002 [Microcystis aeruginosa PCC 9717]